MQGALKCLVSHSIIYQDGKGESGVEYVRKEKKKREIGENRMK